MGRFQLELIYLYFPPTSHLILDGMTVENKGKLILTKICEACPTYFTNGTKIREKQNLHLHTRDFITISSSMEYTSRRLTELNSSE